MPSIVIHPYCESWPAEFAKIQSDLFLTLGSLATRVSHIGSTSVPGLGAKDIIDIQIGVESLSQGVVTALVGKGYEFVPKHQQDHVPASSDETPSKWQKLYFRQRKGERQCHIHVRVIGSLNHRYALLFRDYLRCHPEARATIEVIKRELARLHGDDADAYYAVKDPVYDLVWQAANAWSRDTSWAEREATDA